MLHRNFIKFYGMIQFKCVAFMDTIVSPRRKHKFHGRASTMRPRRQTNKLKYSQTDGHSSGAGA